MKKNSTSNWLKVSGKYLALCYVLFASLVTYAQAPANNDCAGAISLPVNTNGICTQTPGTTIGATTSPQSVLCGNPSAPDVWYTFTAANTQQTITLSSFSSSANATVSIYSGNCPNPALMVCNTTSGVLTVNSLTVGNTYFLRIGTAAQNFNVCVGSPATPPANNECAGAIPVPVNSDATCTQTVAATMVGATSSANPMSCTGLNNPDVWFSFTASSAAHVISTPPFTATNCLMAVYSGSCAGLTQIYCGAPNSIVGSLTAGNTYYVRIRTGLADNFSICINTPVPPANDECAGAVTVPVNADFNCGVTVAGTTVNATPSANAMSCASIAINGDVWFKFTATNASHRVSVPSNPSGGSVWLAAYSGSCSGLTQLGCVTGAIPTLNLTGLTPGTDYYFRVKKNTPGAFNVCVGTTPPPPANNECAGAISLPVNPNTSCSLITAGTTINATPSPQAMSCYPSPNAIEDVWYAFTAIATTHIIEVSGYNQSTTGVAIVVYGGSCGSLSELSCEPVNGTVSGLTVGSTYYVRILSEPTTNFNICVRSLSTIVVNDECAGATTVPVNADLNCGATVASTTVNATLSANAMSCAGAIVNGDVWFKFTATSANHRISIPSNPSGGAYGLAAYSGSCGTLTELGCVINPETLDLNNLAPGTVYYFRVKKSTPGAFSVCVGTLPPPTAVPANNECAGALSLPVNANTSCSLITAGITTGSTPSPEIMSCIPPDIVNDVWFTFTAVNTEHIIDVSGLDTTTGIAGMVIYSGSCGSLSELYCGISNDTVSGLVAGSTYYLRILTQPDTNFNVCIRSTSTPLPVTMGNLEGSVVSGNAILHWVTYQEQNNKGFDILRSENGKDFTVAGWAPALSQNGNSSTSLSYRFSDSKAIAGKTYYQVRQVDMDGKMALSNIITLSADPSNDIAMHVYPNPVKNLLNIDISGKTSTDGHVTITDLMGKVLINHALTSNTATIDLGALPAGVYFVKYANSTTSAIQKIVKK